MLRRSLEERLRKKLIRKPNGCLVWTGATNRKKGYGQIWVNGRPVLVHRVVWEQVHGPIPPGKKVLHGCDNPPCCEAVLPGHLFLGSQTDNMIDMLSKGRNEPMRGEDNGNAVLTEETVRLIRVLYTQSYVPMRDLAQQFGVSYSLISKIIHLKAWTHVE